MPRVVERREIDRVVADAVARDDAEAGRLPDGRCGQRLGADDEGLGLADQGRVARLGDLLDVVEGDVGLRLEQRDAARVQLSGDEDVRHQ